MDGSHREAVFHAEGDRRALERADGRPRLHGRERGCCGCRCACTPSHLEEGVYELDTRDGQPHRIPFDQIVVQRAAGSVGLRCPSGCSATARRGSSISTLQATPTSRSSNRPNRWTVRLGQLVIRREERDRVEAEHGRAGNSVADGIAFQHDDDFRNLRLGELRVTLGRLQAAVVKHLHEASRSGDGWCFGKSVLAEVGSTSKRMSDVFKSKPRWRDLIESDGRGRYRLRIKLR